MSFPILKYNGKMNHLLSFPEHGSKTGNVLSKKDDGHNYGNF